MPTYMFIFCMQSEPRQKGGLTRQNVHTGASEVPAALPEATAINGKRKAEPEEADSPRKKSCTIADSPKVRLAMLPWVQLPVQTLLLK